MQIALPVFTPGVKWAGNAVADRAVDSQEMDGTS